MSTTIATENAAVYSWGREYEEIVDLEKEEFIQVMLKIHQANSSRKWRAMIKNAKMEKSDLSLNTYLQYV